MDDYISRQAAIDACYDGCADCRDDCADNICNLPPADVRPVVTCDRCRYSNRKDLFELWCNGFCHPARLVQSDDFCSHGEASP